MSWLEFEGSNCFRQRLILSTLSLRKIRIKNIRLKAEDPGLTDYEMSVLSLLDKVTNGATIEVDETGTTLNYKPGILIGGEIEHDCALSRSMSYYLEVLFSVAPFCKFPLKVNLRGVTNDKIDPSVDSLKHSSIPLLTKFLGLLDNSDIELKVISRGLKPNGGGHVLFRCPVKKYVKPLRLLKCGKIKRIRGVAYATRVAPTIANRMVEKAKERLLQFIPDVYIYTDHLRGKNSGKSPGFGMALVAETINGVFYTGDAISNPSGSEEGVSVPEDVAEQCVFSLFEDIYRGGCINSINQGLACLLMAIGQTDVSQVELGPLSPYTIQFLRHMKTFFSVVFKLEAVDNKEENDEGYQFKKGSDKIVATCLGIGLTNLSKASV